MATGGNPAILNDELQRMFERTSCHFGEVLSQHLYTVTDDKPQSGQDTFRLTT